MDAPIDRAVRRRPAAVEPTRVPTKAGMQDADRVIVVLNISLTRL